jgi:pyridoxamine 5'-phosphate oxidase-like protein
MASEADTESHMEWTEVAKRLAPARNYWLGTTTVGGAPHAAPVWGVVVDDQFFIYSERHTAKARHLAKDPRVVVHLESAEHVVIVHGRMIDMGRPLDVPEVVDALSVKYNAPDDEPYLPSNDGAFDVLYLLQPERALLWELSDYDASQRRWSVSR